MLSRETSHRSAALEIYLNRLLSKTPAVANGVVYVTGGDTIFALEQATGKKLWRHNLAAFGAVSAPAVSNGIVYVGDGALYALSAGDGHVI